MKTAAMCVSLMLVVLYCCGVHAIDLKCPPAEIFDNCTIYNDGCTSDADCAPGQLCCSRGCELYCSSEPTTTPQALPPSDVCYRYTLIEIYCRWQVHRCYSDADCDGKICCPYGNCGNRCVPSS